MKHENLQNVRHIGDGVYVGHDGWNIWVYSSDGRNHSDMVALEPEVLSNLVDYNKEIRERK